jgi:hypothetical protein
MEKSEEHRFLIITDEIEFSEALARYIKNFVDNQAIISAFELGQITATGKIFLEFSLAVIEAYETIPKNGKTYLDNSGLSLFIELKKSRKNAILLYNTEFMPLKQSSDFCMKIPRDFNHTTPLSEKVKRFVTESPQPLSSDLEGALQESFPSFYRTHGHHHHR